MQLQYTLLKPPQRNEIKRLRTSNQVCEMKQAGETAQAEYEYNYAGLPHFFINKTRVLRRKMRFSSNFKETSTILW